MRWFTLPLFVLSLLLPMAVAAGDEPLTRDRVADYIRTRIATENLQDRMRARADQYDDVAHAFFEHRRALLRRRGWTVDGFDATERRIVAAESAITETNALKQQKRQDHAAIESMRKAGYVPDAQLDEMERRMAEARARQTQWIGRTRPDWPAVRPYLDTLDRLTEWVAGNVPDPPTLEP